MAGAGSLRAVRTASTTEALALTTRAPTPTRTAPTDATPTMRRKSRREAAGTRVGVADDRWALAARAAAAVPAGVVAGATGAEFTQRRNRIIVSRNTSTPATTPRTVGIGQLAVAWARVVTAIVAITPTKTSMMTPQLGRAYSTSPFATARTSTSNPTHSNSTILSLVPKSAIVRSFNHDGARSITREPTASTGLLAGEMNTAKNSATASTTAALSTPRSADQVRMRFTLSSAGGAVFVAEVTGESLLPK